MPAMEADTEVLIVGAGPAGLMLALELARRRIKFRLIEQQEQPSVGSRGKGLQPRTLEVFEQIGLLAAIQLISAPYPPICNHKPDGTSELVTEPSPAPTSAEPYPVSLMVPQWRTEGALRTRLAAFGREPEFGTTLESFHEQQDAIVASVGQAGSTSEIRCRWLVGTDGGKSSVRKMLTIGFPGETRPFRMLLADLSVGNLSRSAWHRWLEGEMGQFGLCPLACTDSFQMAGEITPDISPDLSTEAIHRMIVQRTGRTDLILGEPTWTSLYHVSFRLADTYRRGRALIAGDAAHVHPPTGGQGLNTGVQDAFNLGWKLAAALRGAPLALLDTYGSERRTIAGHVLKLSADLFEAMTVRADMQRGRSTLQLDLNYRDSPLSQDARKAPGLVRAGDRAPDSRLLDIDGNRVRLFDQFARPGFTLVVYDTLLVLKAGHDVRLVGVGTGGPESLSDPDKDFSRNYDLHGPTLLLIRPDGYLAIVADGNRHDLIEDWLNQWLGVSSETTRS